jgi:hypothetical protein
MTLLGTEFNIATQLKAVAASAFPTLDKVK